MYVGVLTACFRERPLEEIIDFCAANRIEGLEIAAGKGNPVLDPTTVSEARARDLARRCADQGLIISAIANYCNGTLLDPQARADVAETLKRTIDLCVAMGTDVLCTMVGMPPREPKPMSREDTIRQLVPELWPPLVEYASKAGVKIAFENWVGTVIMNIAQWRMVFDLLPQEHVGLNFDPSHLIWQQIDYIGAVHEFGKRIFHVHAKDTEMRQHDLRIVGNNGPYWRYVIPGLGAVDWGQFIGALRREGYNGTLSIEHEDGAVGIEEGLIIGERFLRQFLAGRME